MASQSLEIAVRTIVADALKDLNRVDKKTKDLGKSTEQAGKKSKKAGANFRKMRMTLVAVAAAITGVVAVTRKLIKAYLEQEKVEKKLRHTIGLKIKDEKAAQKAMQQSIMWAKERQRVTTDSDEALLESLNMAATFPITMAEAQQLVTRAQDIAASTGQDLLQTTIALGKATEGDIGALRRYGISISDATRESKEFGLIMADIDKFFKGQAEAAAQTSAGALKQFQNRLGDLAELAGKELIPALNKIMPVVMELAEDLLPVLVTVIKGLGFALEGVGKVLNIAVKGTREARQAFADLWNIVIRGGELTERRMLELNKKAIERQLKNIWQIPKAARAVTEARLRQQLVQIQTALNTRELLPGEDLGSMADLGMQGGTTTGLGGTGGGSGKAGKAPWEDITPGVSGDTETEAMGKFKQLPMVTEDVLTESYRLFSDFQIRVRDSAEGIARTFMGVFGGLGNLIAEEIKIGVEESDSLMKKWAIGVWNSIVELAQKIISSAILQIAINIVKMIATGGTSGSVSLLTGVGDVVLSALGFDDPANDFIAFRQGFDVMRNVGNGMRAAMGGAMPAMAGAPIQINIDPAANALINLHSQTSVGGRRLFTRRVMDDTSEEERV